MNVSDKFDKGQFSSIIAYRERGIVNVVANLLPGSSGKIRGSVLDTNYIPREIVIGTLCLWGTINDKRKLLSATIEPDGVVCVWLESSLEKIEKIGFIYPVRK